MSQSPTEFVNGNANNIPLHRRIKIDGLSGRFLRAVVSALAGTMAGSAHILIDVSATPVSSQLDATALAAFLESISMLFGLSCDLLVCHAQTTARDFSQGSPLHPSAATRQLRRAQASAEVPQLPPSPHNLLH